MTEAQSLRLERQRRLAEIRRRERIETVKGIIAIIVILAAFAFAGTLEYQDRVDALTDMGPSAAWTEGRHG